MNPFDFHSPTRFVFGADAIDRLGELVREFGGTRALVVSDPGIAAAGHVERGEASLRKADVEPFAFLGVEENPTTRHVAAAVEFAREHRIDFIVGLGGGSSMDCAKGANFILTNGGEMRDYRGLGKATRPMLPTIAVPTTAGTGSEAQSFALIADERTHEKMACGDKKAACRAAILDPKLTLSMPREVAAVTGMDALAHALETWVSRPGNAMSRMFSRQAWELLAANFPRIFVEPNDLEARGAMLVGASLAGLAIESSMLGAAHSMANPITARYGVTHGRAVGIVLPHVIRANGEAVGELYAQLLPPAASCGAPAADNGARPGDELARVVEFLRRVAGLERTLGECGVEREALPAMAAEAAAQWTAQFNPRELTEADFLKLYEAAY